MNWKSEAIEQLSKYDAMVKAVKNIPEQIRCLDDTIKTLRTAHADALRLGKTRGRSDDHIINNIVKRQELEKSYQNAVAWVRTTEQAMSVLNFEERQILEGMYIRPEKGIVSVLCEELGIEQSSVYRRRDHALYRFTIALYGIC